MSLSQNLEHFPLLWSQTGNPLITVSAVDWYRHTLASGGDLVDRKKWLKQHFVAQVERGDAGVFLNIFGTLSNTERRILSSENIVVDLSNEDSPVKLNLTADMSADDIGHMLAELSFGYTLGTLSNYEKQHAIHVLTLIARALREINVTISCSLIAQLIPPSMPLMLQGLMYSLAPQSETRQHLAQLLSAYEEKPGTLSPELWAKHNQKLSSSLENLSLSSWTSQLFSNKQKAIGLLTLLSQNKRVIVECSLETKGLPECAILHALRSAVTSKYLNPESSSTPWIFALSEVHHYVRASLAGIAGQCRKSSIALLLTSEHSSDLTENPTGQELLDHIWNMLHLKGCPPERITEIVSKLESQPVLEQPTKTTVINYEGRSP